MRGLTLEAHWAYGVSHLGKRIENRGQRIPAGLIGHRVAIHAGAALPNGWLSALYDAAPPARQANLNRWANDLERRALLRDGQTYPVLPAPRADPVTRAIVATAVLDGCTPAWVRADSRCDAPPPWAIRAPDDPDEKGVRWWWGLADVRRLVEPVMLPKPFRGQLGLWHLDRRQPGLTARVEAAKWVAVEKYAHRHAQAVDLLDTRGVPWRE